MLRQAQVVTAKFGQHHGPPLRVLAEAIGFEINVQAPDVAHALIVPAAGMVDGSGIVQRADAPHRLRRIELAPALVEGRPHGDAGAVVERFHRLRQFEIEFLAARDIAPRKIIIVIVLFMPPRDERCGYGQLAVASAAVGHILPDQHAQPVAVVIPAQRLQLDVLAQHIEAHPLHRLDVVDHGLIGGRCEHAVRPVALIQHAGMEVRRVVELQARHALTVHAHGELAHGKIAFHAVLPRKDRQIIQIGIFRRPGAKLLHGNPAGRAAGKGDLLPRGAGNAGAGPACAHTQLHHRLVEQRRDAQAPDMGLWHTLQEHRLPDAALGRIEDAAGLHLLLAAAVVRGVRHIPHAHNDGQVVPARQRFRKIRRKGRKAAHMVRNLHPVCKHRRRLIHRAEVQQYAIALCRIVKARRQAHPPAVPEPLVRQQQVIHPGQRRLRREGDQDGPGIAGGGFIVSRDRAVPSAVQVQVALAPHLRAGILRQNLLGIQGGAKARGQGVVHSGHKHLLMIGGYRPDRFR